MKLTVCDNGVAAIETDLEAHGVRFTPLALEIPADLGEEVWAQLGRRLCRTDQVLKWWIGDWAAYGLRYDDKRTRYRALQEFARANGINYQTLANLAWVSRNVTFSRRRENVEWSKHAEVAALEPKEQKEWLGRAEKEELPVAALRQQIRISQGESNALKSDGPALNVGAGAKAASELWSWLESKEEDFWTGDRCEAWLEKLRPVADFYGWLQGRVKREKPL
jgi:hypothetical protein